MATNINVRIVSSDLIAKAKAQQEANRQAQVERERRERLEREARRRLGVVAAVADEDRAVLDDLAGSRYSLPPYDGYPVAAGFGGLSSNTVQLWARDATTTLSKTLTNDPGYTSQDGLYFEESPETLGVPRFTGSGTNRYERGYSYQSTPGFILPVNKGLLIYCIWRRVKRTRARLDVYDPGYYYNVGPLTLVSDNGPQVITYTVTDIVDFTDTACFLVGATTIKEITFPSALLTKVQAIYPEPTFEAPTYSAVDVGELGGRLVVSFDSSPTAGFSDLNAVAIMDTWGAGWRFDDYSSAGIFKTLDTPSAVVEKETQTRAGAAAFMASLNPPNVALNDCQLDESCTATRTAFDATMNPDDVTPVYKRNRAADVTIPDDGAPGTLLAAWDWGRPGYCRDELLALGFTESDLTP